MEKKDEIQQLKELYPQLLSIIEKYGRGEIDSQIRQVKLIISYLNDSEFENLDEKEQLDEIRNMHQSLFPPRGGLSDFFIWSNDFDERLRLNKPLDDLREKIWAILKK